MILQNEMIDLEIISTGSKGNAVFLDGQVLIDCGVPFSKLVECEVVDRVKYVFLTHQHGDHCNVATLKRLLSEHPCIRIIYPNYLCKKLFLLGDTSFQYNSFIVAQDNGTQSAILLFQQYHFGMMFLISAGSYTSTLNRGYIKLYTQLIHRKSLI